MRASVLPSKTVSSSEVKDIFKLNGDIYVEIDSNNNFTRLYATGNSFVDLDVTFTYPTTVNVEKPTEYETSDILDSLLKGFNFGGGSYSYSYGDDDDDYDYDIDYGNGDYDYNDDGSWTYPIDDDDYDWSWIYDDEDSNVAN